MTAPVMQPAACPMCHGARVIAPPVGTSMWVCPECCCAECGQPTDTPPECRWCAEREEAAAKRRADV